MADAAVGQLAGSDLWGVIAAEAQDEAERRAAYLCFVLETARSPGTLSRNCAATVDDVYGIKRNLLDRLRRNPRIRAFLP